MKIHFKVIIIAAALSVVCSPSFGWYSTGATMSMSGNDTVYITAHSGTTYASCNASYNGDDGDTFYMTDRNCSDNLSIPGYLYLGLEPHSDIYQATVSFQHAGLDYEKGIGMPQKNSGRGSGWVEMIPWAADSNIRLYSRRALQGENICFNTSWITISSGVNRNISSTPVKSQVCGAFWTKSDMSITLTPQAAMCTLPSSIELNHGAHNPVSTGKFADITFNCTGNISGSAVLSGGITDADGSQIISGSGVTTKVYLCDKQGVSASECAFQGTGGSVRVTSEVTGYNSVVDGGTYNHSYVLTWTYN